MDELAVLKQGPLFSLDDLERSMHYNHQEQCALVRAVAGDGT